MIGGSARVTRYSIHMASTSRPNPLEEDDDETEEEVRQLLPLPPKLFVLYSLDQNLSFQVQHFADFTLASSWERYSTFTIWII